MAELRLETATVAVDGNDYIVFCYRDMTCPPTPELTQKYGTVVSVTAQLIFSNMSDACSPAVDVHMTAQDVHMARSFEEKRALS